MINCLQHNKKVTNRQQELDKLCNMIVAEYLTFQIDSLCFQIHDAPVNNVILFCRLPPVLHKTASAEESLNSNAFALGTNFSEMERADENASCLHQKYQTPHNCFAGHWDFLDYPFPYLMLLCL